ncbi:MAG: hypothetical protein JKY52_00325 [Flavobacteriales bacterium]|nr:hypothetical protein [Flavobacteriales bacterium]
MRDFLIKLLGGYTKDGEFDRTLKAVQHAQTERDKEWGAKTAKREKEVTACLLARIEKTTGIFLRLAKWNHKRQYRSSHIHTEAALSKAEGLDLEGSIARS